MSTEKRPLISFVVSVYNLEQYVRDCLDSIVNQPFDDYEIMLVDNGSTDGSRVICQEYADKYPQIKYHALTGEPRMGRAIEHGAAHSIGEYIQFVDVDDMLVENIYDQVEQKLKSESPDVLFGRFETLFVDNIPNFADRKFDVEAMSAGKESLLNHLVQHQPFVLSTWRLIVRRDFCYFLNKDLMTSREHLMVKNVASTSASSETVMDANSAVDVDSLVIQSVALDYDSILIDRFEQEIAEIEDIENATVPINPYFDVVFTLYPLLVAESVSYLDSPIYVYRVRGNSFSRSSAYRDALGAFCLLCNLAELETFFMNNPSEKAFIRAIQNVFFFQYYIALAALNVGDLPEFTKESLLFLNSSQLSKLSNILPLVESCFQKGAKDTLLTYYDNVTTTIKNFASQVQKKEAELYVAPVGKVSHHLKATFDNAGVSIVAFLDNDPKKEGFSIDETPVLLPAIIKEKIDKKMPVKICIGVGASNVCKELEQQFLDLGVSKDDLMIINI